MAGRFKETKKVGHQSNGFRGGGGGRAANLSATTSGPSGPSARQRANEKAAKLAQEEDLDGQFGFARLRTTPPDNKPAYMFNMRQSQLKDIETGLDLSCLDMYFVQETGQTFRASHIYQPYFLIHVQGNTSVFGEVEQYLMYKYPNQVCKCAEFLREDLDLPNHLSGIQRKYMKVSFRNVDDLTTVRHQLQPMIEKNKLQQAKKEEVGMEGFGSGAAMDEEHQGGSRSAGAAGRKKNRDDCMMHVVDIREYDVLYVQRVSIDTGYRCGLWYEVQPEEGTGGCTLKFLPEMLDQAPLKKMAFDIETTKAPLKFPNAEIDNIMMISYMVDGEGFLICNRTIIAEDIHDFEYTPKPEYVGEFTVYNVEDEKALLEKWIQHIEEVRPHLYVTYNGDFFDWPFIAKRCTAHGIDLAAKIGIWESQGEYMGRFSLHLDAFRWVQRDSYLPQGSQGLKAVTKHKLKYEPVELDPEDMLPFARDRPQELAAYSVSDAVATYYLYMKFVHLFVFSLATIIPMPPSDVLRKGSGTLCELLLMVQAYEKHIVSPNKEKANPLRFHKGHLLESETYIGGHVECLESGVFRSDLPTKFRVVPKRMQMLLDGLDRTLRFAIEVEGLQSMDAVDLESLAAVKAQISEKLVSLRDQPNIEVKPLIYHLDVGAMYPNIILTNRLQPMAIVDAQVCAACDFNRPGKRCQRVMKWSWRGRFYPATQAEFQQIKAQMEVETFKPDDASRELRVQPTSFSDLPFDQQAARIMARVKGYSNKVYKGFAKEDVEERDAVICQRENPFYVDTVRAFRDRRYEYKRLGKKAKQDVDRAAAEKNELEKVKANDRLLLYDSLQLAHKCILNSFYGYVMRRGARWHSIEMAGVVTQTGANIIKDARILVEEIGRPLELDTDGIWCMPESDTRVLTSRGFLFLEEIESALADDAIAGGAVEPLLFASYSVATRSLQYLQAELVIRDGAPPARLVDFTQATTRALWESPEAESAQVKGKINHVSIRVTPRHDMFVQLGNRTTDTVHMQSAGGAEIPFAKMKAEQLTAGRAHHSTIQFLHAAELGADTPGLLVEDNDESSPVRALKLDSPDAIDAFLELYGYWLGDGSMQYRTSAGGFDGVLFSTVKDEVYLRCLFARLALVEGTDWRATGPYQLPNGGGTVINLLIVKRRWFDYFDAEYWLKYKTGRERRGGLRRSLTERLPALQAALDADADAGSSASITRSELQAIRALHRRGIRPPNIQSAKWFWWWVLKRLSARQMRLLLAGLRCADGDWALTAAQKKKQQGDDGEEEENEEAPAPAAAAVASNIYTSSVCFRDFLVQACLHAGFTACSSFNQTARVHVQWQRRPHDGHLYSTAEMVAAREEDENAVFVEVKKHALHWRVCFSARPTRLLDVADVRYDGMELADTREKHGNNAGWIAPSTSAASTTSPPYSVAADGRLWCVRLPSSSDQLIVAQRAQRGDHGQVSRVSRPVVLGNCMIPSTFPESYKVKLKDGKGSVPISYPCSMLNVGVADGYTNDQYWGKRPDGTMGHISECSIFFEVDGPYRAMILPAAREEGKNIKKRYAVFAEDGSLSELKGFEIKRRGELKLIKIFQEQVFKRFLDGQTLQECYESVGAAANHWLDVCYNQGHDLEDDDVFELISENKSMSDTLESYGDRKSTSIQTAKRLGEFLGGEMVKDKGLSVKFIITKKPFGAPTSERAVPVAIFSAEDAVKKEFLRRWLKDSSLSDFDVRGLVDWEYYIGRLGAAIQKIITIPAAFQKIRNPVARVPHPDWLTKRVKAMDDTHKQTRLASYFQAKPGGAASAEASNDMEDIANSASQFTNPLKPKFATVKRRLEVKATPVAADDHQEEEEEQKDTRMEVDQADDEERKSTDESESKKPVKKTKRASVQGGATVAAGTGLLDVDPLNDSGSSNDSAPTSTKRTRRIVQLDEDGEPLPVDDEPEDEDDEGEAADPEGDHPMADPSRAKSDLFDKIIDVSALSPQQFSSSKRSSAGGQLTPAGKGRAKGTLDFSSTASPSSRTPSGRVETLLCEETPTDENFADWMKSLKSSFTKINKGKREARRKVKELEAGVSKGERVTLDQSGLTGFLRKQTLAVRASYWQIVQMFEDDVVPGMFRVWVVLDSGMLKQMIVHVPRVIFVNARAEIPDNGRKIQRLLPRGRPCLNLYEVSMSEGEYRANEKEFHSSLQNRHEIEGVYETQVPLLFKLIMEVGCVCKVDARVPAPAPNEHTLAQLVYKTTAECPYLSPALVSLRQIYLYHSTADSKRGIFGVFVEGQKQIQVIAVNGFPNELERANLKRVLTDCVEAARQAGVGATQDGSEHGAQSSSQVKTPTLTSVFAPLRTVKTLAQGFEAVNDLLREFRSANSSPTVLLAQTAGLSLQMLYSKLPVLKNDFPVVMLTANLADNQYPAAPLPWYSRAAQWMIERYVAHPQWWVEQLHFCRYAHVPIGNMESDYPAYISDLFFARALKHSGHLLWMSKGPRPDLGGLEEDENYFADEHINPEASKPGIYRKVCMEIDIGQLAVNAIVQQNLIEEMEGSLSLSSAGASAAPAGADAELVSLRSLQEGSTSCRDAFRVLKNCVGNWLSDTIANHNEDADMLLRHFYRWLRSPSSKLYDGALHRFVHALMKKILAQLLARFRKLGSVVIYANQSKVIIATGKPSIPHALAYTQFILKTIKDRPLFQMLELEPSKAWETFAFMDNANFGGLLAQGQSEEGHEARVVRRLPDGREREVELEMHWNICDYLPRGLVQEHFLECIAEFLCQPSEVRLEAMERIRADVASRTDLPGSQVTSALQVATEKEEETIQSLICQRVETSFAQTVFRFVEEILRRLRGDERAGDAASVDFPILCGSHLPLHNPALEFVKSICAVMSLDEELRGSVRKVRESLMKLVGTLSFSAQADFINPCLTFILPDVICSYCNQCRDLDLCRDPDLLRGRWECTVCSQPYDLGVVESTLVEFIQRRAVAYQVQDLQCATCGKIKVTNMAKYCPCSGHFVNTTSPKAFDTLLRTFSNISVYHRFAWLRETVDFIRERQPEITEFDLPEEEKRDVNALMNDAAGVGASADNQIRIE